MFRLLNGGLDLAAEAVFGATTKWHAEIEAAPAKVLTQRWPGVPNLHDLTTVDWDDVEPVDIMTAGYPCQPFSHAGQRKGTTDERHIWPYVREAIRRVRPRYTLLENVAGHRSLGFDRVLGDLAEDGLHVRWTSLRAADVGAPHGRERVFILVTDPTRDTGWVGDRLRRQRTGDARRLQPVGSRGTALNLLPTPKAADGEFGTPRTSGRTIEKSTHLGTIVTLLPTPCARDWKDGQSDSVMARNTPSLGGITHYLLPTPAASDSSGGGTNPETRAARGHMVQLIDSVLASPQQWGKYAGAIARWEQVAGPAPSPTEPNSKGNPRLSARFAEWMMGLPAGWVTDVDLPRTAQLKCLGNGVVPPQAEAALRQLLATIEVPA